MADPHKPPSRKDVEDSGAAEKKKLASVWDQDRAEREAEEAQLRNLFGGGPPKKGKR